MNVEEREFFTKIKQAAFSNPFGEERRSIDLELTRLNAGTPNIEILAALEAKVAEKIRTVIKDKPAGMSGLSEQDRLLLRYGILFSLFHTSCHAYDRLIEEQIRVGATPCRVVFAADVLQKFSNFGFSRQEGLRYFALFFQMRRAFYFISGIAGSSQCIRNFRSSLWENIFTKDITLYDQFLWNRMEDFSTLLLGETGSGKGLAAAAIGRSGFIPFNQKIGTFSESFTQAFVSINLSQYSEQLIESELFGHTKGAFTGAVEAHSGIFSRCSPYGAIFLDEIGDVAIPVQIKLLQVLQERVYSPVGCHKLERFQGRVIAATNKNIGKLRHQKEFRDDFYYRLCSDIIEVPPLRRRLAEDPTEIDEILIFIIKRILGQASTKIVKMVKDFLDGNQPKNYAWPGNVRELEQCVRRVLLKNAYDWPRHESSGNAISRISQGAENGSMTAQEMLSDYCRILYDRFGTYEAVAQRTQLDRRTVKKYIQKAR
ncbi:MAG: sigma 54-interacting transcriptional regulator [Proteobacteria bacterium]|nr:sigma 54-interacting transcriptional regulator [Pseudomonadota bacterium]